MVWTAAERAEVSEGQPGERAEVAVPLEAGKTLILSLVGDALAGECLAKVGMAQADRLADESGAAAARAQLFAFVERGLRDRVGRRAAVCLRGSGVQATRLEDLFQTSHLACPRLPTCAGCSRYNASSLC